MVNMYPRGNIVAMVMVKANTIVTAVVTSKMIVTEIMVKTGTVIFIRSKEKFSTFVFVMPDVEIVAMGMC